MIVKHLQSFFASAGSECCYALCLIDVAREYLEQYGLDIQGNELDALENGIARGFIDFNFDDYSDNRTNFYVRYPSSFLCLLTGADWTIEKQNRNYKLKSGEYGINFSALSEESGRNGKGHFWRNRLDPLQNSVTVKNGFIYSKRVLRAVSVCR